MNDEDEGAVLIEKPPSALQAILQRETFPFVDIVDIIRLTASPRVDDEDESEPESRVLISLADQHMWIFEGDAILTRFPVSTGVPGHRTPPGHYSVRSKAPRAYSRRYECWMLDWMAITPDGLYGMHSLEGTSYLRRIGSVASHGCIRLTHEDARWLYDWVEVGMPVEIVQDWDEPEEDLAEPPDIDSATETETSARL
jgi:lipoprotein-anchoring transpeptidase ErfK/SrfK